MTLYVLKVDTRTGEVKTWAERNAYCAEPMFVPTPGAEGEDDGVVISTMIRGKPEVNNENRIFTRGRQIF